MWEGDNATLYATFGEAARIGERFGDAQLMAFGRIGVGEALIRSGPRKAWRCSTRSWWPSPPVRCRRSGSGSSTALYEFTAELASQEPPPPELQKLLGAMHGNQEAMDGFARVSAGVMSPAEFFSEENVTAIFAAAR